MHTQSPLVVLLMCNTSCQTMLAKETFFTITWHKLRLPHPTWSLCIQVPIPVQSNAVIQESYPQINLKISMPSILIVVEFPVLRPFTTQPFICAYFVQFTINHIQNMNDSIESPAENLQVIAVGSDSRRIVRTIPIILVHRIEILGLVLLSTRSINCIMLGPLLGVLFH